MRKFLAGFSILLLISILLYASIYNYLFTSCPDMNTEYFDWFPYREGDVLIFESKNNVKIELEVSFLEIIHTDAYMKFVKCGYCEDSVQIIFTNEKDTLDIIMNNLDNPKSYFGYSLSIYSKSGYVNYIQKDSIIGNKKNEIISSDDFLFAKYKGFVKYKRDNEVYYFKRIIMKMHEREKNKSGC